MMAVICWSSLLYLAVCYSVNSSVEEVFDSVLDIIDEELISHFFKLYHSAGYVHYMQHLCQPVRSNQEYKNV